MRPIHLSIAGLHSFREKQEIDFERLCAGGVFGIFGPTGSGKSTILDAITLALYGKVERATNNTQGIMNHAVDTLSVSFTFQLGKKAARRYRVERTFKRTGEVSMRTSACRLVERNEAGEEVVLADKEREVTARIQELLGLTNDDFTRAVVLPQGKFAEFLSLKGVERRQMLQRLFHLEKYGDRLNQRLKARLEQVAFELDKVLAEQQGLGEASQEVLDKLKGRLEEAVRLAEARERELKKLEAHYEEKKQLWQWQKELEQVERELAQLHCQREEIERVEERLKLAQEASLLKPYAEELRHAEEEVKAWTKRVTQLKEEAALSRQQFLASKASFESLEARRKKEEPLLIARRERLKQAKETEGLLHQKQQELIGVKQKLETLAEQEKSLEESLAREKALHEKALVKQQQLKEKLAQVQVPSELRIKLRQANEAKERIKHEQSRYLELEHEWQRKKAEWQEKENRLAGLTEQVKGLERALAGQFNQATRLAQDIRQLARHLEEVCAQLEQRIKEEEELLAKEREEELAVHLAQSLRPGEPCPVCGSREHPHPIRREASFSLHKRKEQLNSLEAALAEAGNARYTLDKYTYQLEQLIAMTGEAVPTLDEKPAGGKLLPSNTELAEKEQVEKRLEVLLETSQSTQQEIHALEEALGQSLKRWREWDGAQREQRQLVQSLKQDLLTLETRLKELANRIYHEQNTWQENFPAFQWESIEEEQARLDAWDQEAAELAQRIEKSVTFIQEKEQKISQLQEQLNQLRLNKVELSTKASELREQQEVLQKQMEEHVGAHGPIEALLKQVESRLQELVRLEQQAFHQFQEEQNKWQTKEKEESSALEALNQAEKRYQRAGTKWQESALGTGFHDTEAVFQALIPIEEASRLSEQVKQYREQEQKNLQEKARLQGLLRDREISAEEWQHLKTELAEAKEKRDEAIQLVAKAARDLEEMQGKHERYQQLEDRRLILAKQKEQLTKLGAVLRGNSFVEYVATEQLMEVCRDASYRLGQLTRQRYALEVDSNLGFVIRDNHNGGVKRPVTSLSGGETFLTSLALALALSAQIQLRGEYPLEFFFLDEGFGTLDQELLDTVITALEKLNSDHLSVGVISHVPELKARISRKLLVHPESSERGTTVSMVP